MKKWIWLPVTAVALAAVTATGFEAHRYNEAETARLAVVQSLYQAEEVHETLHDRYRTAMEALEGSSLTVTEDGQVIGVYSLEDLGLAETARSAVSEAFDDSDRLSMGDFESLSQEEQLATLSRARFELEPVPLDVENLDAGTILNDLNAVSRTPSKDCAPEFTGSAVVLRREVFGNELDEERVVNALSDSLEGLYLADDPLCLTFEVTDCDPYVQPAVTMENQSYDLDATLRGTLREKNYALHVDLWGDDTVLDADACAELLHVGRFGALCLDQEKAEALVAEWAAQYDADQVPYLFRSYSAGKVELPFKNVNRRLNQEATLELLGKALSRLSGDTLEAPFDCTDRSGKPFSISGSYIEVDIARQTMSCFRDGELLVSTPVVSGRSWGHMTPSGYYKVQTKSGDRWLNGDDYSVFVHYWLGFYGAYGIHDASWRSDFSPEQYINNGSHGCVNTPTEPMEQIWNFAEIGLPVVVFNIP